MSSEFAVSVKDVSKTYILGKGARQNTLAEQIGSKLRSIGKKEQRASFDALHDVSFNVKQGEAIGIVGRNGAGKSTLLKVLTRVTPPSTGEIVIRGRVGSLLEIGTGFHPGIDRSGEHLPERFDPRYAQRRSGPELRCHCRVRRSQPVSRDTRQAVLERYVCALSVRGGRAPSHRDHAHRRGPCGWRRGVQVPLHHQDETDRHRRSHDPVREPSHALRRGTVQPGHRARSRKRGLRRINPASRQGLPRQPGLDRPPL